MTFLKLLSKISILVLIFNSTYGQTDSKLRTLRNKVNELSRLNNQLSEENINLHNYMRKSNQTISNVRDSINAQLKENNLLTLESKKWQEATFNVNKSLQASQKDVVSAQDEIRKMKYEIEILKDPNILRIYNESAAKVKEGLIARLSESSLGFQFDEENGGIKATKQFGNDTEAWWVFDKTIDILLELNLKVMPHLYDPNRSMVYGSTNLLEKVRYSNKQYSPQDDIDKIRLYQEKAIRILETNIRKLSVK